MKDYAINLVLVILAIFAPAKAMVLSSMVLVLADLITGIMASRKKGKPITSSGLQRTVIKLFVYESAILLAYITEVYLLSGAMPCSKVVAGLVGITELKSCLENLNEINGQDILKQAINKLGSLNQ